MPDQLLTRVQLAKKMAVTPDWISRNLEDLPGFPQPVIPHHWSEGAVERWFLVRSFPNDGQPTQSSESEEDMAEAIRAAGKRMLKLDGPAKAAAE